MISRRPNDDYQYVHTVYTSAGALRVGEQMWPKARLWVLEDRTIVAIVPGDSISEVERITIGEAVSGVLARGEATFTLSGSDETVQFRERTCGSCGMGAVGSAGPVEGKWRMERIRLPEWVERD